MTSRLHLAVASLATVAAVLAPAATARVPAKHAGAQFSLVPVGDWPKGYFVVDARPGEHGHAAVLVTNEGDAAGTVRLAAVDATTGRTSGAVYLDRTAPRREVGRWIDLAVRELRLAPHETARVPIDLTVPADVRPGEHLGGLVAEPTALAQPVVHPGKRGALAIRVRQLSIVAFQVNIPGPRIAKLGIAGVSAGRSNGYQWLYLRLRNDGNRMVKPHGRVVVRDSHGRTVATETLRLDTFLPHTAIAYPVVVRGKELAPGRYLATVELAEGAYRLRRAGLPFTVSEESTARIYGSPEPHFGPDARPRPAARPAPAVAPAPQPVAGESGDSRRVLALAAVGAALLCLLLGAGWTLGLRRRRRAAANPEALSAPVVEAIAQRAAELMLARLVVQQQVGAAPSEYLTVAEAAEALGCSPQRVHGLMSAQRLTRHKQGRRTLVSRAEVEAYRAERAGITRAA